MDWLDRLAIFAIVMLLATAVIVSVHDRSETAVQPIKRTDARSPRQSTTPVAVSNQIEKIRNLIESQSLDRAEQLTQVLIQQYPNEGSPHMLLGDIYLRRQEVIRALYKYRDALENNPDYLDKKTPVYQGKKIKNVVVEGLAEIKIRATRGGDEQLDKDRKLIYYLQRRIAGACG